MNWLLAGLVLFGSVYDEVQELIRQSEKILEGEGIVEELSPEHMGTGDSPCRNCRQFPEEPRETPEIMVFMSFSVPLASWKDLSDMLEKRNGVVFLRGMPESSFRVFGEKIMQLRGLGINIPIRIDPELFEEHDIKVVPSYVVREGDRTKKYEGNFRIDLRGE